jgi:hypothetical protein
LSTFALVSQQFEAVVHDVVGSWLFKSGLKEFEIFLKVNDLPVDLLHTFDVTSLKHLASSAIISSGFPDLSSKFTLSNLNVGLSLTLVALDSLLLRRFLSIASLFLLAIFLREFFSSESNSIIVHKLRLSGHSVQKETFF